jgi:hypothetical protein
VEKIESPSSNKKPPKPSKKSSIRKYELGDYFGYVFENGATLPKTKKCTKCNITASDEIEIEHLFNKHAMTKDGYANICKLCYGKKNREGQKIRGHRVVPTKIMYKAHRMLDDAGHRVEL